MTPSDRMDPPLEKSLEDRELVQKLLAKDPEAERLFFNTYRGKIYKTCTYILGHLDPEAEDTAQEAFIVALRKLPEFEFRSSLNRWLYRICVFLCFERIRKRRRQIVKLDEELESLSSAALDQEQRRKEEESERQRKLQMVRAQRDLMGYPCQEILKLWDEDNQSYAAIAETLRIPIGTVMSRLTRCKEALKEMVLRALGEEGIHA